MRGARSLVWILPVLSMAACASTSTCPPIKQYDRQWNNELAAELATAGPRTVEALSDYSVLRRQLEQCQ